MSEIKRASLITLGTQKDSDKSEKEPSKTVRISVVLPESTEDTCPEYNYKDQLAAAKKSDKRKDSIAAPPVNGLRKLEDFQDDDDDDDVKRIAKQMEEKYGTGTSTNKKKRKGRKDDYADIGMGYDESDSFIDNTDGYDEMIPQNVTTLHGGFYINSGALEFKTDDEANSDYSSSSSDEEDRKKDVKRRRVIESSDETDRENKTEDVENEIGGEKKRKLQNGSNGVQSSIKKKLMGQSPLYIKKRRLLDAQKKTVKELLREKRHDLDMSIPIDLDATVEEEPKEKKSVTASKSNVSSVIESVVKDEIYPKSQSDLKITGNIESSHEPKPEVKLPENLPADIVNVITAIKRIAEKNTEGKNYFSSEVNLLILRLERKCKCLGKPSKMKVYEYLAGFLNCKQENLIRRAKNLMSEDEAKKLKNILATLKQEINKTMPVLLDSYEKETQRVLQKKIAFESVEHEESKSLRMPKRRFQWNDITKKLLKDILMLKKRCLLLDGKLKEDLDAQMLTFLKTDIQILWPEGWMSMNALNKIYTTYADPKRLSNGPITASVPTASSAPRPTIPANPVKNISQNFNSNNISITPISLSKSEMAGIEVSVKNTEASINLSMKPPLPETAQSCDIKPTSPKKDVVESRIKVKSQTELLKPKHVSKSDDSVIILDACASSDRISPTKINDNSYCQVIDLSDKNEVKKIEKALPKREKTISPMMPEQKLVAKHHELSITPAYPKVDIPKPKVSCPGDDIQKVMENLKVLQKMSSPTKNLIESPNSSAVSVIAVNKSFAPKPVLETPTMQRYDYKTSDYTTSFQEEFQKQLFSAYNPYSTPTKTFNSIDRYPHISTGATGIVPGDKYYQNSNNNYPQSSNGHKSSNSTPQTGTYSILDDMFANLLTQYGYTKEATSKPPSK